MNPTSKQKFDGQESSFAFIIVILDEMNFILHILICRMILRMGDLSFSRVKSQLGTIN